MDSFFPQCPKFNLLSYDLHLKKAVEVVRQKYQSSDCAPFSTLSFWRRSNSHLINSSHLFSCWCLEDQVCLKEFNNLELGQSSGHWKISSDLPHQWLWLWDAMAVQSTWAYNVGYKRINWLTLRILKWNIFNPVFLKFSCKKSYCFEKNGHAVKYESHLNCGFHHWEMTGTLQKGVQSRVQ